MDSYHEWKRKLNRSNPTGFHYTGDMFVIIMMIDINIIIWFLVVFENMPLEMKRQKLQIHNSSPSTWIIKQSNDISFEFFFMKIDFQFSNAQLFFLFHQEIPKIEPSQRSQILSPLLLLISQHELLSCWSNLVGREQPAFLFSTVRKIYFWSG